jgi:CelD/BcsL family acetyltransferase involved in cellulose biosynthesis
MDFDVVTRESEIGDLIEVWTQLATSAGRPYCLPQWGLNWWHNLAPAGAELRILVARDGSKVTGIAPFFATRSRAGLTTFRLLAQGLAMPVEPVAEDAAKPDVARAFAGGLAGCSPGPDFIVFEGLADRSWPRLLADTWPQTRPLVHDDYIRRAPAVSRLDESLKEWLGTRSSNFRQQIRRNQRRLESLDVSIHRSTEDSDTTSEIDAFCRLHHSRWRDRGGSGVLTDAVERMLRDSAPELLACDALRLWFIRSGNEVISSQLFLRAGGTLSYWLGGFDDAWAKYQPAQVTLLAAVEGAIADGDRHIDLGYGEQLYKSRFADSMTTLEWSTVVTRGSGYSKRRAAIAPRWTRRAISERVPPNLKTKINETLASLRR